MLISVLRNKCSEQCSRDEAEWQRYAHVCAALCAAQHWKQEPAPCLRVAGLLASLSMCHKYMLVVQSVFNYWGPCLTYCVNYGLFGSSATWKHWRTILFRLWGCFLRFGFVRMEMLILKKQFDFCLYFFFWSSLLLRNPDYSQREVTTLILKSWEEAFWFLSFFFPNNIFSFPFFFLGGISRKEIERNSSFLEGCFYAVHGTKDEKKLPPILFATGDRL